MFRNSVFAVAAVALTAWCVTVQPMSAQSFEGAITMRVTGVGRDPTPHDVEYLMRRGKVRINTESAMGQVGIIGLSAEKKFFVLMDARSVYLEFPMDAVGGRGADLLGATQEPKVTRTGKREVIADYECEHITVESATND